MSRYLLVRVGQSLVSLWAVVTIVFLLVRATGDPAALLLPVGATQAQAAQLRQSLGLNQSLASQYVEFLGHAVRGNFGNSIVYSQSALSVIEPRLAATLQLVLVTFAVILVVAVPAGVYAAAHRDRPLDRFIRGAATVAQAVPNFWVGTILIIIFGVELRILPTFGNGGIRNYVMPVISLALLGIAALTRLTRSSVLEALSSEYIKFARAKGVAERAILWRHALRNGVMAVVTLGSLLFLGLLTGAVIIETVFSWPGIGQILVTSVSGHDYPVVQAIVVILSAMYIGLNFILDVAYGFIDPRVRVAR